MTPIPSVAWLLAWTIGCVPMMKAPLSAVPILGGSSEQREALLDEIARFEEDIGPGRIELRSIELGEFPELRAAGVYQWSQIRIQDHFPPEQASEIVRHELCHALDDAEGLSAQREEDLALFAATILTPGYPTPEHRRMEAFARLCEQGPHFPQLLAVTCEGRPDHGALARWMASEIWNDPPQLPQVRPPGPRQRVAADFPLEPIELSTGWSEAGPRLKLWGQRGRSSLVLDPYTGVADADSSAFRYDNVQNALAGMALPDLGGLALRQGMGSSEVGAALVGPALPAAGGYGRVAVWDGQQWAVLDDTCPSTDRRRSALFLLDGRVWQAEVDGDALSWGPLAPGH